MNFLRNVGFGASEKVQSSIPLQVTPLFIEPRWRLHYEEQQHGVEGHNGGCNERDVGKLEKGVWFEAQGLDREDPDGNEELVAVTE